MFNLPEISYAQAYCIHQFIYRPGGSLKIRAELCLPRLAVIAIIQTRLNVIGVIWLAAAITLR